MSDEQEQNAVDGNEIIRLPYWGQCIFLCEKDVLFVVLYGE